MIFIQDKLNFIIFYSLVSHLLSDYANGKHISKNNLMAGKLKNEKISTLRSESSGPIVPLPRSDDLKPNLYYNREIYDYSTPFDSFYNNLNNYPQSSVSYYPFSLQNVDYLYPKIFNRFYPYTSNIMPRTFQYPLDYQAQDNPMPLYRDAQSYEPASEYQLVKRLVPIGYSTHLITPSGPSESIGDTKCYGDVCIRSTAPQEPIPVSSPKQLSLRSAAIGSSDFDKLHVLLKALENAAEESSTNSTTPPMSIRQKVETVARLLILAPSFADEIFKCLSQSEAANKFIQTAQNFSGRVEEPTTSD